MFTRLLNNSLLINKKLLHNKRYLVTPPSLFFASDILESSERARYNAIKSDFSVKVNTNHLECYNIMKENNLNYIKVMDGPKITGILSIMDVRNKKLWYDYETEEHDRMLRDLPKL